LYNICGLVPLQTYSITCWEFYPLLLNI